ncbi:MAG: tRNA (uridine(54)-C5)-methyltransferase TrmA [Psittacicella sp.]
MNLNLKTKKEYQAQLDLKISYIKNLFSDVKVIENLDIYTSEINYFRMRAEFRIFHDYENNKVYHSMFDKSINKLVLVDTFPIASKLINSLMQEVMSFVNNNESLLREKLFQVDYLTTLSGEVLITLIYHKKLSELWIDKANSLKEHLIYMGYNLNIIGRAKNTKIELDKDYVLESLSTDDGIFKYKQIENSFTQPNALVNTKMINWAKNCLGSKENNDLLELYCGNGNFTLPLSKSFNNVLATEISSSSIKCAEFNILQNNLSNIKVVKMSAEDLIDAFLETRVYRRLNGLDLKSYNFSTVFVDPPRAGIDLKTLSFIKQYDSILYISCNPKTLRENYDFLKDKFEVKKIAIFDQFAYSDHIEVGMYLCKK